VLGVTHLLGDALTVVAVAEHLGEQDRAVDQMTGGHGEQIVKRRVDWAEAQSHGELLGYGLSTSSVTGVNKP
jgi:hypothetical protein